MGVFHDVFRRDETLALRAVLPGFAVTVVDDRFGAGGDGVRGRLVRETPHSAVATRTPMAMVERLMTPERMTMSSMMS